LYRRAQFQSIAVVVHTNSLEEESAELQASFDEGYKYDFELVDLDVAVYGDTAIHFHMLFLDGVYIGGSNGHTMRFQRVKAPTRNELTKLTHTIAHRVARYLVCTSSEHICYGVVKNQTPYQAQTIPS